MCFLLLLLLFFAESENLHFRPSSKNHARRRLKVLQSFNTMIYGCRSVQELTVN